MLILFLLLTWVLSGQRKEAIQEINEDIHQLKVAVETLKQYHQDDDEEKDDEAKDAEGKPPDNDAG